VNIATLRVSRQRRGGDAFMVIEVDDPPGDEVSEHIRALDWVRWVRRLDRVTA
jgi:L-serine dehydratase